MTVLTKLFTAENPNDLKVLLDAFNQGKLFTSYSLSFISQYNSQIYAVLSYSL